MTAHAAGSPRRFFSRAWRECASSSSKRPSARQPSPLLAAFANQAPRNSSTSAAESPVLAESPARPVVQSRKLSEAAKEKLDAVWADAIYATALPFNLLDHPSIRTAINTTADLVRTLGPLSVLRRSSEFRCCRERTVTHMNGGKYIPPNRKRLADDLLDKAEARETESLKDVLIRLARQKKSGSIVLDGRKSISKLPMVNFLFHCADGTWLIECVASNAVRGRRCCTTSPLVSRASRSRSAQRSDVGKHVPTSIAPNENDLALREQQSSLACATTCGSGRRGGIRPLSRCVYHRWC